MRLCVVFLFFYLKLPNAFKRCSPTSKPTKVRWFRDTCTVTVTHIDKAGSTKKQILWVPNMRGFHTLDSPKELSQPSPTTAEHSTRSHDHREHPAVAGLQEGTDWVLHFSLISTQHRTWHTTGFMCFVSRVLGPAEPARANIWARLCSSSQPPIQGAILWWYRWRLKRGRSDLPKVPRGGALSPGLNPKASAAVSLHFLYVGSGL